MLVHFGQQNGDRRSVNLPCLHLALLTYIYVNAFYNEILCINASTVTDKVMYILKQSAIHVK